MKDFLVQRLKKGAQGEDTELRERLNIEGPLDDTTLSAQLVRRLAKTPLEIRGDHAPGAPSSAGTHAAPGDTGEHTVPRLSELEGVRAALAWMRSGTLAERRQAARRVKTLLEGDLSGEDTALCDVALATVRDPDASYELLCARRALPGAAGQEARDEDALALNLLTHLDVAIQRYWDGETSEEPITQMPAEELALVALRLHEASDALAAHVGALIDGSDASLDVAARRAVIAAFRHAGDKRLLPPLAQVLATRDRELSGSAARAIGRIEDPRSRGTLLRAYRASVQPTERAVIAGALGLAGEMQGRAWVRALLSSGDDATLRAAVDAMASLGQPEDVERLAPHLDHDDPEVVRRTIRALGRSGDGRALLVLARLRDDAQHDGALAAELEEAEGAIFARLELRGETAPAQSEALLRSALSTGARAALLRSEARAPMPSWWGRLRAWFDWMVARAWVALGLRERGLLRLELAAMRRPGWAAPLITLGASYPVTQSAHALTALRRALEADRAWVESHAARLVARVFLRRAEETAKAGRSDIARSLLEEALSLDLRRAPSSLRYEMERRLGALRGDGA